MLATPELITETTLPERLSELLPRWLREKPIYRPRINGFSTPPPLLSQPLITKADIRRDFPYNFLGGKASVESLIEQDLVELEHTSGTSEDRTPLLLPRGWWAEQEDRALRMNRFVGTVLETYPEARRVTISSPVCSGDICYTGVPSRHERTIGNSLFISLSRFPWLWSEADLARMADETADWEPQFLDVDPVYGTAFALYCERRGITFPSLRFVLCSYEFVSINHRRILERALRVPVFNLYGSTETGHLLMEDEEGQMRPSMGTAFLEVLHRSGNEFGELVVTTLTNEYMPLIRYRIGDLVQRRETPYGDRYVVHGRVIDAVSDHHGQRVTTWQIDQCFDGISGVAHYQLSCRGPEHVLRIVPESAGPGDADLSQLCERIGSLLGSRVSLELKKLIMPESSGKFRIVVPLSQARSTS